MEKILKTPSTQEKEEKRDFERDCRTELFNSDYFKQAFLGSETVVCSDESESIEDEGFMEKISVFAPHLSIQPDPLESFSDSRLPGAVKTGLSMLGLTRPTAIQKYSRISLTRAIPIASTGSDIISIAKTGSGKTLAYMIPCVMQVMSLKKTLCSPGALYFGGPLGLILAPTRELAIQIHDSSSYLGASCGLRLGLAYGGAMREGQLAELSSGVDILIATPGRLIDYLSEGVVNLFQVGFFVLDEADRMLDMGFYPQVRRISMYLSPRRQSMFLSATWPEEVERMALEVCRNKPVKVKLGSEDLTLNTSINQKVIMVVETEKRRKLLDLLKELNDSKAKFIVFVRTKKNCDKLSRFLEMEGYSAAGIHGGKVQHVRCVHPATRQHLGAVSVFC